MPIHNQIVDVQARLQQRAAQLRREIDATMQSQSDEPHADIAERARDAEDDSFASLVVDVKFSDAQRDADELRRIDDALRRMEEGRYGVCQHCGEDIPVQRLEVEPTAARCIKCQEVYERTHATASTPSL